MFKHQEIPAIANKIWEENDELFFNYIEDAFSKLVVEHPKR